jgi:sugar fermentation stimulation protein A
MKFDQILLEGTLKKRYKRFLADVILDNSEQEVLVHVPNSGSMLGVSDPGSRCRVSVSSNPKRKIPYTLEMVLDANQSWVGVNTSLTNKLVAEAFKDRVIPFWNQFLIHKAEVTVSNKSRLDFSFSNESLTHFVEVKNVSMSRPPIAVFPDAVTERGQKHLRELMTLVDAGHGAEIFFVVQREDCHSFRPCDEIDKTYGLLLREAAKKGVKIQCWACEISAEEIRIVKPLPVDLSL